MKLPSSYLTAITTTSTTLCAKTEISGSDYSV